MKVVDSRLNEFRTKIDEIDAQIIKLLNKRAELANKIGELKKAHGLPVYVPSREDQVIMNVKKNNPGPLNDEAVERIFKCIIAELRRFEQKEFEQKKEQSSR